MTNIDANDFKYRHNENLTLVGLQLNSRWYNTCMPAYEIYFRCDDCKREHPTHLRIYLDAGPQRKETLATFFHRGSMPPQVAAIRGRKAFCLKTGGIFKLESDDQILLVPFTDHRPGPLIPEDDP